MPKKLLSAEKITVHCDGGARNNPGPAAIGVVIDDGKNRKEYSEYLGQATNNQAEYQAVIFALKKIKHLVGKEKSRDAKIEIKSDSELLVNQLNGEFKIKDEDLQPLFFEIWNTKQDFGEVKFVQVPREENKEADKLVNRELDSRNTLI